MANELSVRYGEAAVRAVRMAFVGGQYTKHEPIIQAEQNRIAELNIFRERLADLNVQTTAVLAYVEQVVKTNPGIVPRVK